MIDFKDKEKSKWDYSLEERLEKGKFNILALLA
jgi:hypothetical protein